MDETAIIATIDDLRRVLSEANVALDDVSGALGLSRQALGYRLGHGGLDGLSALALLRAAISITNERLALLQKAAAFQSMAEAFFVSPHDDRIIAVAPRPELRLYMRERVYIKRVPGRLDGERRRDAGLLGAR